MGTLVFVLLIAVYWFYLKRLWLAYRSASWPCVVGEIVKSELVLKDYSEDEYYQAEVKYEFAVHTYKVTSDVIAFQAFPPHYNKQAAKAILANYPVGRKVKVYHHPFDYSKSVLEPGLSKKQGSLILLLAAITLFIISAYVAGVSSSP